MEIENITVVKNYEKVSGAFIDRGQIHQVFLNLSINARHAMKVFGKGELTISIKEADDKIKLYFSDTGTGIKKKLKIKYFFRFFQQREPILKMI